MYQINNEKFGHFLAEVRKEKQMTQKDLADKLFVSIKIGQSKLRQIHHFYFFGCPCVVGFCGLPAFWLPLFFNTISSAFTYQSTSAPV